MVMLPDGVHIGLGEPEYFEQDALGSTDRRDLWLKKEGWWWSSPHNPHRRRERVDTVAMLFGSAVHCYLLEGQAAFEARFAVAPAKAAFPDLLETADDLISALAAVDAPGLSSKMKKADLVELGKVWLTGRHIWDAIMAKFQKTAAGRPVISTEDLWELQVMHEAAMADPDTRVLLTAHGGVPLAEVSVFWTDAAGIRHRFRFDSLLPAVNGELKTLGNVRNGDLARAVSNRIGDQALDCQAAMSFEARREVYRAIVEGRVFGGTAEERAHLARFPDEAPLDLGDRAGWNACWLFYGKAEDTGMAPTLFPVWFPFGSLAHREGHRKGQAGLALYRAKVAEFGLGKPWTRIERMRFMDPKREAHRVLDLSPYLEQPPAAADEQEALAWTV